MADNAAEELKHQNTHLDPLSDAASRMKGVLDDPYAAKAEPPQEEIQQEEDNAEMQASEEVSEEIETEEVEEPDEGDSEVEARKEGAEQEPESIELEAEQFAELLGIEHDNLVVDDEGRVRFRAKGEKDAEDVTLEQLINAYQGNANLTNRSKELAEIRKQEQKRLEDFNQQITTHAQQAAARLEAINQAYENDVQAIDWKELQEDDPGMYAAKKLEMADRKKALDDLARQTISELEAAQKDAQEQQSRYVQEKMAREHENLRNSFKEMNVKLDEGLDKSLTEYMTRVFPPEVIQQIGPVAPMDQLTILAYKAMMFDKGKAKAEVMKVKKIPKVLKPGTKPSAKAIQSEQMKQIRAKHKKEGTTDSAADLLKGFNLG